MHVCMYIYYTYTVHWMDMYILYQVCFMMRWDLFYFLLSQVVNKDNTWPSCGVDVQIKHKDKHTHTHEYRFTYKLCLHSKVFHQQMEPHVTLQGKIMNASNYYYCYYGWFFVFLLVLS